jgi:hypothetical protein
MDYGHIYIVQLDEHKKIYKIGKTNESDRWNKTISQKC